MLIRDILTSERTACAVEATSKKKVLEKISELIASAETSLTQAEIFDCLLARERLGSTGLGHGVALPHGRVKHGERTLGAFIRMREAIDYDAVDHQPVDLLFALLVPENSTEEHLQILSQLAEMFSNEDFRAQLRICDQCEAVYALLTRPRGEVRSTPAGGDG